MTSGGEFNGAVIFNRSYTALPYGHGAISVQKQVYTTGYTYSRTGTSLNVSSWDPFASEIQPGANIGSNSLTGFVTLSDGVTISWEPYASDSNPFPNA